MSNERKWRYNGKSFKLKKMRIDIGTDLNLKTKDEINQKRKSEKRDDTWDSWQGVEGERGERGLRNKHRWSYYYRQTVEPPLTLGPPSTPDNLLAAANKLLCIPVSLSVYELPPATYLPIFTQMKILMTVWLLI